MAAIAEFTVTDLDRVLQQAAGASPVPLDADSLDAEFSELGYESLGMLETASQIERELGIELDDSTVFDLRTPRAFLLAVNERLAASRDTGAA